MPEGGYDRRELDLAMARTIRLPDSLDGRAAKSVPSTIHCASRADQMRSMTTAIP